MRNSVRTSWLTRSDPCGRPTTATAVTGVGARAVVGCGAVDPVGLELGGARPDRQGGVMRSADDERPTWRHASRTCFLSSRPSSVSQTGRSPAVPSESDRAAVRQLAFARTPCGGRSRSASRSTARRRRRTGSPRRRRGRFPKSDPRRALAGGNDATDSGTPRAGRVRTGRRARPVRASRQPAVACAYIVADRSIPNTRRRKTERRVSGAQPLRNRPTTAAGQPRGRIVKRPAPPWSTPPTGVGATSPASSRR